MNILYIGTPNSIHDFKWISFFTAYRDYKIFFVTDKTTHKKLSVKDFELYETIGVKLLPPFNEFSFVKPFQSCSAIINLRKKVSEHKIDVVHSLFGSPYPVLHNFISCKSKIITTRGSDVLVMIAELEKALILKIHLKLLFFCLKRSYLKANHITCTSQEQINKIQNWIGRSNNVQLIKTGVDVDKVSNIDCDVYLPKELRSKKIIFSPRFMRPVYNFEFQVEAFKKLPKWVLSEYEFVFIRGVIVSDSYYNHLIKLFDEIKGFKYVVYKSLSQNQIWAITKRASLSIMVPKSDGTPNTALEAMACKTPLILGDLDYNKELFEGASLVVDLNNPKDLSSKIQLALEEYPQELLQRGFANVRKYGNREVEMTKLKKLYEE